MYRNSTRPRTKMVHETLVLPPLLPVLCSIRPRSSLWKDNFRFDCPSLTFADEETSPTKIGPAGATPSGESRVPAEDSRPLQRTSSTVIGIGCLAPSRCSSAVRRSLSSSITVLRAHFFAMPVKRSRSNGLPETVEVRGHPPHAKKNGSRLRAREEQEPKLGRERCTKHLVGGGVAADRGRETTPKRCVGTGTKLDGSRQRNRSVPLLG